MEEVWKIGIGIAGLGGLATFFIYSLYKRWLELPIFQQLEKKQLYNLFKIFFVLTFLFAISALGAYVYLESNNNDTDGLVDVANFQGFLTAYEVKYEDIGANLDKEIMTPLFPKLSNMNYDEFEQEIIKKIKETNDAEKDIEKVANFYERVLKCEKNSEAGCSTKKINEYFGQPIHDFWYSYRPYMYIMRKNGYPYLAKLVEIKAQDIESLNLKNTN